LIPSKGTKEKYCKVGDDKTEYFDFRRKDCAVRLDLRRCGFKK